MNHKQANRILPALAVIAGLVLISPAAAGQPGTPAVDAPAKEWSVSTSKGEAPVEDAVTDVFTATDAAESVLEGYLARRMRLNVEQRLLSLRLEDILKPFVQRPGAQEWVGEHVGKFLHAASLEWERTRDPRLRARMDLAVQTLIESQLPDGYLGTYRDKDRWTQWDVWSHKYNLIGLLEYHRVTGDGGALDSCRKIGDLLCDTFGDGKRDIIRSGTHVGMAPTSVLEPMVMLHRKTGEKRYLEFCDYLVRSWDQPHGPKILSSLLTHGSVRRTANNKSYEMMSNLVGLLDLYRMTGRKEYLQATVQAWKDIRANQNYATGTSSWAEHFQEDGQLNPRGGTQGKKFVAAGEGCVTVSWMQMNWHLLRLTGEAVYAEELERSIYNALLAAQSPADGTVSYFLPMLGRKCYGEVTHGIPPDICCCSSSIPRGIAMIRDLCAGTIKGNPAVLLYSPGKHVVQSGDGSRVVLQITTDYPKSGAVDISVTPTRNGPFTLLLRVPSWCREFTARVGEETHAGKPGQFLPIRRDWSAGDLVRVVMDMPTVAVPQGRTQDGWVAIQRGPRVLALDQAVAQAGVLPNNWIGDEIYQVSGVQDGKSCQLPLVPVAEAGQSKSDYEAVFQRFALEGAEPAATPATAARRLDEYRTELDAFRREFGGVRTLPDVPFFLFGMGHRAKWLYKSGALIDTATGKTVRQWPVRDEIILPSDYAVSITTPDGNGIRIFEDESAVWIEEDGQLQAIDGTRRPVRLPSFDEYRFPRIMRVLHQELLVNVINGMPVPNHFVYSKPWYRDAAMMAMCFKATGNLDTIKDWVMGLSEPFDHNNKGESEADNPGQALYLISLVGDRHHPLVPALLKALQRFEVEGPDGKFIKGRSDFAEHPVYQTKWAKYGLTALGLEDPYTVPRMPDSYSALFWWDYKDSYIKGKDASDHGNYPYLGWAIDHFHGTKTSPISNRDYPLTWEQRASQARYEGTRIVSEEYTAQKISAPHTWHAAEVFLYLLEQKMPTAEKQEPRTLDYDVAVYGGTPAGVTAAIQAARLGKSVIFLSFNGFVGGMTSGGLTATDLGDKESIGGMALEFYQRVGNLKGFSPSKAEAIYRKMLQEAGITLLLNRPLTSAKSEACRIVSIDLQTHETVRAKVFVDATYEGDLLAAANVSYHIGREPASTYNESLGGQWQHVSWKDTYQFCLLPISPYKIPDDPESGLLPEIAREPAGKPGEGDFKVQAYNFRVFLSNAADRVPFPRPPGYNPARYALLARFLNFDPKVEWKLNYTVAPMTDGPVQLRPGDSNNAGSFSTDYVGGNYRWPDGTYTPGSFDQLPVPRRGLSVPLPELYEIREKIFHDHINYQMGLYHFLAHDPQVPEELRERVKLWGLDPKEFPESGHWPHQLYIREGRRMVSDYVMTQANCEKERIAEDSIGLASYPMDSHFCQRVVIEENGKTTVRNEGGFGHKCKNGPYPVSYRSIVPKREECENLLVPVSLSSSHVAFGSIRMEPVFMILGQSAGTAAAIAIEQGVIVQQVPYETLKQKLSDAGQKL